MKVTYQFVTDLMKLLQNEDWTQDLVSRLNEIDQELDESSQQCAVVIQKQQERWGSLEQKIGAWPEGSKKFKEFSKKLPSAEQQEMQLSNTRDSFTRKREALNNTKKEIQECLDENKYHLGTGVFEDIENAQLLLAKIHFLDIEKFNFNPDSLAAVKSMLKSNFKQLYNLESDKYFTNSNPIFAAENVVEKFLQGRINKIEDLIPSYQEVSLDYQAAIQSHFNTVKLLDVNMVSQVYEILKPFYHIMNLGNIESFVFELSIYFNSPEDVASYLANEVDFSSEETMENDICLITGSLDISTLSKDTKEAWYELNAKFGKEAIKLFAQANDLQKIFDIVTVKREMDSEKEVKTDPLELLFQIVQKYAGNITFEREEEGSDLAKIVRKYQLPETLFNRILNDILPKQKNNDLLPEITFNLGKNGKYTFEKLPAGDLKALFLGKMTACCQFIGGDSEKCVIDGFTRQDASFYVL